MDWDKITFEDLRLVEITESPLYCTLREEIWTGNDDAAKVLEILQQHSFEALPEDTKLDILICDKYGGCADTCRHVSILAKVMSSDYINTMRALLPKIPLYRLARKSVPDEYKCMEHAERQRLLLDNKSRWSPGECECKSHTEPENDGENLCAMAKLGSDALANELFWLGLRGFNYNGRGNTTRCLLYLLAVCPQLLQVPVYSYGRRLFDEREMLPLAKALITSPELASVFLDQSIVQYFRCSISGLICSFISLSMWNSHAFGIDYVKVFMEIAWRMHKEKERQRILLDNKSRWSPGKCECKSHTEPENDGENRQQRWWHTLFVCSFMNELDKYGENGFCYLKYFLQAGFDPAYSWNARGSRSGMIFRICGFFETFCDENYARRSQEHFLSCIRAMLPYFKDPAFAGCRFLQLPQLSPEPASVQDVMLDNLKICQAVIDYDLFPTIECLLNVIRGSKAMRLWTDTSQPCVMCEPLAKLIHREMCKGLPIRAILGEGLFKTLRSPNQMHSKIDFLQDPMQFNTHTTSPTCCLRNALELLVHSKASLGQLTSQFLVGELYREKDGKLFIASLDTVRVVVEMLWMYDRSSTPLLVAFLHKLATATNPEVQATATKLLGMMERVHPLALLARKCIIRNIEYEDIPTLPLPPPAIRFLQIGDVSPNHPLRK